MKHKSIIIHPNGKMEADFWKGKSLRDALEELVKYAEKMEEESIRQQEAIDGK